MAIFSCHNKQMEEAAEMSLLLILNKKLKSCKQLKSGMRFHQN
jgi:hypothetical protein